MPYIVVVNLPGCMPEADPIAVATATEALETACGEMLARDMDPSLPYDGSAIEDRGAVIPLSDGYVIDVQYRTWSQLAAMVGMVVSDRMADAMHDHILTAYND